MPPLHLESEATQEVGLDGAPAHSDLLYTPFAWKYVGICA